MAIPNQSEMMDTYDEDVYIKNSKAYSLLSFVTAHILSKKPDDPLLFTNELFCKCLRYRKGSGTPPVILTQDEIRSVCKAFTGAQGGLTTENFCAAMNALLIKDYKIPESSDKQRLIDPNYFVDEVMRIQTTQLQELCLFKK